VEQERRERAEAELTRIGAQWLGTETQEALAQRAEAERRRSLDAERNAIAREADARVAEAQCERDLLLKQIGAKAAPTQLELRCSLRRALQSELAEARQEASADLAAQLAAVVDERDHLDASLRRAEAK